ncbi:protein LONGIFOLIA 1 [Gastrolobium bilobum]|uniref:protein LONGIFOLIA 1 n=1 Tax=Gastrolobium bilobum TaxID=150636 RepID=UPI002AB10326|nr:protein LONGIFOLIA 1 [Gastrolobium bilobum]
MTKENLEKHIKKQMGCMTGFLQIFDRHHQMIAGKRIYSPKRLPPSPPPETHSSPETDICDGSPAESSSPETEIEKTQAVKLSPLLPLPVLQFNEGTRSSWKFSRESPRLSLDSRAVVDAKGTFHPREADKQQQLQRRSTTSVVARLMGLEDSDPQLRRSASESRVSRDLPQQYRFFDTTNNFQLKQQHVDNNNGRASDPNAKAEPARGIRQKKSFYDSADFFPDPKHSVSVYGETKLRGIDEPSKDLDTMKQILEALQLKGLLHSNKSVTQTNHRNFVFDGTISGNDSPIVVMKPARSSGLFNRTGNDSQPGPRARRNNETLPARPETDRNARGRNVNSPTRSPNRMRKVNDGVEPRTGVSHTPVHSSKLNSRSNGPGQQVTSRSPRMRKAVTYQKEEKLMVMAEDESSNVSESSFSISSYTDTERFKMEEYREGKNLLQRCDELLNSIAEMTAAAEQQPSPVSVLDSSFYKDESSNSPSPVMKRCIDYKDQAAESEDDVWSAAWCCSEAMSEDSDFVYVSEILHASNYLLADSDLFLLLEKRQYLKGNDTSRSSTFQRRLIFDTIHEILDRNRRFPPWKAVSWAENTQLLRRIWSEFRRIRDREESEDLFAVICGVLRKDMAEDATMNEWGECPVEMGDVVLDIERSVFKDLIVETIRDLASFKGQRQRNKIAALRRKLVF